MTETFDKVVGVTFDDCQEVIMRLRKGDKLKLVKEPENQYDPKAVRVIECSNKKKVGYVKRDGWLSHLVNDDNIIPEVEVYAVTGGAGICKNFGLTMKVKY